MCTGSMLCEWLLMLLLTNDPYWKETNHFSLANWRASLSETNQYVSINAHKKLLVGVLAYVPWKYSLFMSRQKPMCHSPPRSPCCVGKHSASSRDQWGPSNTSAKMQLQLSGRIQPIFLFEQWKFSIFLFFPILCKYNKQNCYLLK